MDLTEEQVALEQKWTAFCLLHQKAAMSKGTVGKTGGWEPQRFALWKQMVKAGLRRQIKQKYRTL